MPGHQDQGGFSFEPAMMVPFDHGMDPSTIIEYPLDESLIVLQPFDNTCHVPDQSFYLQGYYHDYLPSYPVPIGPIPVDCMAYGSGRSGSLSSTSSVDSSSSYAGSDYSGMGLQGYSESIYHSFPTEMHLAYPQVYLEEQDMTGSPIYNAPVNPALGLGADDWFIDQPPPDPTFQFPAHVSCNSSSKPTPPMPIPIITPQNLFDQPLHLRAVPLEEHFHQNQQHVYNPPILQPALPVNESCGPPFPAASVSPESSFHEYHARSSPSTTLSSRDDTDDDLMRALMGLSRHPWPCKYEAEVFTAEDMRLPAVKRRRIYINSLEQACNQMHAILRAHGLESPTRPGTNPTYFPGEVKPRDNKLSVTKAQYETTLICRRIVYFTELEDAQKKRDGPILHHPHSDPTLTLA